MSKEERSKETHTAVLNFIAGIGCALTSESLFEHEKLNCIRVIYKQFSFPERQLTPAEAALLSKLK